MLGPAIGAAASIGGALLSDASNKREASRARAFNRKQSQQQRKLYKKEIQRQNQWSQKNIDLQKEFAQSGIRWKVEDAKAAGIHPLYALGANTTSYSPVSVGGVSAPGSTPYASSGGSSLGGALADAGQNIGRAVSAMATPQEKIANGLALKNMELQNDLLASQIYQNYARSRAPGTGPGMPGASGPRGSMEFGPLGVISPPPRSRSSQEAEDEFWEIGGALQGIYNLLAGDWHSPQLDEWKRNHPKDRMGRYDYFAR